jgi:hypothetical protein
MTVGGVVSDGGGGGSGQIRQPSVVLAETTLGNAVANIVANERTRRMRLMSDLLIFVQPSVGLLLRTH